MLEVALVSFTTFFATVGPLDVAAIFAALTHNSSGKAKLRMAVKGVFIGSIILTVFMVFGTAVLSAFGISIPALRTAGGILLFLVALDLVFARHSGVSSTTSDEEAEAANKADLSVFPLATPLIAGPGAMGAAVLLIADTHGNYLKMAIIWGTMLSVMLLTFVLIITASQLQKLMGITGLQVIARVFGVILAALAVQFVFDGLSASGLFVR